jgi:predicted transcriptional regulator of viral defense system
MALADRQHGAVAHRQLLAAGLTRREIQSLGWLRRIHRGVYVVGAGPMSRRTRWMAAILACGEEACLCGRSAAAALGLGADDPHVVHVAVPRRTRSRPGIRTHELHLAPHEQGRVHRIPCTEPNRTIADLAATATRRELERAMDEAAYHQSLDLSKLGAYARRSGRGCRLLRDVLYEHDPGTTRTRSELEETLLRLVDAHGLPRPEFDVAHTLPSGRSIRIDALYAGHGLALELDGRDAHTRAKDFQQDRERDRRLTIQGLRPVRYTYRDLNAGAHATAAEIARLLNSTPPPAASRCPRPGWAPSRGGC